MIEDYDATVAVGDSIYQEHNKDMKNSKFEFLTSSRFWAIVIGALSVYLQAKGYIGQAEMQLIATITAAFTLVRTADRMSEQKVLAAGVSSGQVSAEQATGIPPEK